MTAHLAPICRPCSRWAGRAGASACSASARPRTPHTRTVSPHATATRSGAPAAPGGANAMAAAGSTAAEVLQHYYAGATIALMSGEIAR